MTDRQPERHDTHCQCVADNTLLASLIDNGNRIMRAQAESALAAEREKRERLEAALRDLEGDVYLCGMGEITREQLCHGESLRNAIAALASLSDEPTEAK